MATCHECGGHADLDRQDIELVSSMIQMALREVHTPRARDGIVVAGSYDPKDGTVKATYADTAAMFPDTADEQIDMPRIPLTVAHYGDQYGAVGNERVVIVEAQGGPVAHFHYDEDDSPGAPAGERWITHRNLSAGTVDSYSKYTNDAATTGDGKGGLHHNGGALQKLTTSGGYEILQDETGKVCHIKTPAGHIITADDNAGTQGITVQTAGGLSGHFDDVAKQIKHAATSAVYTLVDGNGNAISHVAAEVGIGDLVANLDAVQNAAQRYSDQVTFAKSIQKTMGNVAQQMAQAAVASGVTNASAWLAAIQAGLPSLSFADISSSVAALNAPAGSSVVRIK